MTNVALSSIEHISRLGVTTRYCKALQKIEISLLPGVPTLICPLAPGKISSVTQTLLKQPVFVISSKKKTIWFEAAFAEIMIMEFNDPARNEAIIDNEKVIPGMLWPPETFQQLTASDWMKALLKRYFFERIVCSSSQDNCTYFLEKQIINEVINIVFRTYESRSFFKEKVTNDSVEKESMKWVKFLKQNVHRGLTSKELEAFAGLSTSELSRLFKQEFGTTPLVFHRRARLEEAKKHIDSGKLSVNQAATAFGYSDGVAFRHAYKKMFKVSPKR
jgi:AraC-like DNA-binding protein